MDRPEIVETTAQEVRETSIEEKFLDEMRAKGTQYVLVTNSEQGIHMYKNADIPTVLGLVKTAETMATMELTRGIGQVAQRQNGPMPTRPINS